MHSPVQLLNHHLSNVQIRPLENIPAEKERVPFAATRQRLAWEQAKNNPRAWRLKLRVELVKDPTHPQLYEGFVEMIGEVAIHEQVPEAELETVARVAGGSLLYSAIREWVANLTARSLNGMVEIPSVNPGIFAPAKGDERKKASKPGPKKPAAKKKTLVEKTKSAKKG